jgi:hypothetical protein
MEKLNIESLFRCKTNNHTNTLKTLDVKAISQIKKDFDTTTLIESRERKRKKLLEQYVKTHENCLRKIEIANKMGKSDLLYSVTDRIVNCPEYDPINSVEYIKRKLDSEFFDTYIVSKNTLFITWLYIELNQENAKK